MAIEHCGPYDSSKVNPVDARNDDFLFTSDGQAVKLTVEKRSRGEEDDPWISMAAKNLDLAELEAWLYGDEGSEPEPEPEHPLSMPAVEFTDKRPSFVDILRARRPGGHDLVYKPNSQSPTFADFLERET